MRTRLVVLVSTLVLSSVAGCGSDKEETSGGADLQVTENVAYAEDSIHQQLDIYVPGDGDEAHPVAVYLHGGGWQLGDKETVNDEQVADIKTMRDALLDEGYAVVAVNYRLTDEAIWPAQITDVKAAVRYVRANAAQYQLDAERVVVWGESAGGHLAQMMAVSNGDPTLEGTSGETGEPSDVSAAVSYYGISDVALTGPDTAGCSNTGGEVGQSKLVGGSTVIEPGLSLAALASPINYVDSTDAPTLLLHGKQDCVVAPIQSQRMYDKLQSAGVPSELTFVDGTHSDPVFFTDTDLQRQALDWFDEYA